MIIGIDGWAGVGKDTVADILVKDGFVKVSFADALREAASHSFNIPINHFLDRDIKDAKFKKPLILKPQDLCTFCDYLGFPDKCDEVVLKFKHIQINTPRELLQFVGTEIARKTLSETIWLDKYQEKIAGLKYIITPDARFSNERELIKSLNGQIMWIDREGFKPESKHISANDKWSLDKYDVIVYNTSKFDLKRGVRLWWILTGTKR